MLLRAVLVDDEIMVRTHILRIMIDYGFTVRDTSSAERALELLAVEPAEVVVTDIKLRGISGCQLLRKIAELYPDIRGLLISGYMNTELINNRECSDTMPLLSKPFTTNDMYSKLTRLLIEPPWVPRDRRKSDK